MGIADSGGNVIARYSYDEWGKLLDIATAQENSEEQMAIAEINPLRYRGYYYDNETGMYYLQSRYYNPDLCRFISADGFDYINTSNLFSSNAYAYCWNNPVAFDDIEGTTPKISIDMQKVVSFFKNANEKVLQKFTEHIEKLQIKFNAFAEKTVYYLKNPDELINNTLSKIFGREVKIKFHFIEKIKEFIDDLTENFVEFDKLNGSNGTQNETQPNLKRAAKSKSSSSSKGERSNAIMAIFQGLIAAIELDGINNMLKSFGLSLKKLLKTVTDSVVEITSILLTVFNVVYGYFPDYIRGGAAGTATTSTLTKMFEIYAKDNGVKPDLSVVRGFGAIFALIGFSADMDSAGEGELFSKKEDTIMNVVGLGIDLLSLFFGPVGSVITPILSDIIIDVIAIRKKGSIFMY